MEISSLPFLSSEDLSFLYNNTNLNMFPEMDDHDNIDFAADLSPIADSIKRRRLNDADGSGEIKGILTSLLMLEDDEERARQRQSQSQTEFDFLRRNSLEAGPSSAAEMETGQSRARRVRRAGAAAAATSAAEAAPAGQQRRLWVKDRSKDWWEQRNSPEFPEEEFRKDFRMSKATFEFICEELDSAVTKKNTMLRDAIPVRQRVAVCIWRLATGEPLRLVSKRFGLGISTCHKLVLEVCSAIKSVLMPKFIAWPRDGAAAEDAKRRFEEASGIKNVVGAMYTTHVPIIAPKVNVSAYFNRRHTERNQRTSYSITVQGVADARGVFSDVCIGWPGSMPDDQVLEKSAIFQRAAMGELRESWIAGGPGYPLLDWLLVPYSRQNLTWAQHAFNERLGAALRPARDAFSRLKARWSCLQKRTEVKLQDLPVVLGACCTLHNICELRGDGVDPDHAFEVFDDEMVAPDTAAKSSSAAAAAQTRDQIAHHLLHHGFAGTAFL